jgi:hypothetical protein
MTRGVVQPPLHRPVALFAANLQVDSGIFAGKRQALIVHIIYPVDGISPRHLGGDVACHTIFLEAHTPMIHI